MGEPLALQQIFFGTMAGAVVVLMGASYALFFALGRLHHSRSMRAVSLVSFALLAAAVYVLVQALSLNGVWIIVTMVMLGGYFLLPRAIWHLCTGTHAGGTADRHTRATR